MNIPDKNINRNDLFQVFDKFISKQNFKQFLDDNLKTKNYNLEAYLDDLQTQYGNTGIAEYELSNKETKSGTTEFYYDFIDNKSLEQDELTENNDEDEENLEP